jgi:hypothetical protein
MLCGKVAVSFLQPCAICLNASEFVTTVQPRDNLETLNFSLHTPALLYMPAFASLCKRQPPIYYTPATYDTEGVLTALGRHLNSVLWPNMAALDESGVPLRCLSGL